MLELAGVGQPIIAPSPGSDPSVPGTLPGAACHEAMEVANGDVEVKEEREAKKGENNRSVEERFACLLHFI